MKSDTRINVGAVIGMGTLLLSVMVFQGASTNARFDDVNARFDDVNIRFDDIDARFERLDIRIDGLDTRIDGLETRFEGLETRFEGLESNFEGLESRFEGLESRVDELRSDMREDHAAIHVRLDALQEGQSEIGQRLSHVEGRLSMPRGVDGEATPRS